MTRRVDNAGPAALLQIGRLRKCDRVEPRPRGIVIMDLSESWEAHASEWIKWARAAGHDSYWRFHRDQFLHLLPPPGRRTLDLGCGEGRLTRHLKSLGHTIVGIDSSPSLVAAARTLDPSMDFRLANAARLPLDDARAWTWRSRSCRFMT
jgi:SAM-dependent methyltransferase